MPIAIKRLVVMLIVIQSLAASAMAADHRDFADIVPMAITGAFAGSLFGMNQYGQSHNMNPKLLALGTAYGLASGALLGAGIDMKEMVSRQEINGDLITESIVLGGVSGAFLGAFWGFIPYALESGINDQNFYQGFIGAGIGGVVGASIWLTISLLTEPLVIAPNDSLKMKIGVMPETQWLNLKPEEPLPLVAYRCMEINF